MIFPKIPAVLFLKLAVVGLLMAVAYGAGNLHATDRLLREREELGAITQAENHKQLILWYRDRMKEIRLAREQQEGADAAAYAVLSKGRADAEKAAQQARASLRNALAANTKLTETNSGLRNVTEMLAVEARRPVDPGCVLSGRLRVALDYASGASDTAPAGDTETAAPGVSDGSATSSSPVTCIELANGYIELGRHDQLMRSWVLSWQAWAREALK